MKKRASIQNCKQNIFSDQISSQLLWIHQRTNHFVQQREVNS